MIAENRAIAYARNVANALADSREDGLSVIVDVHGRPLRREPANLAYKGAKVGRRTQGWVTASTSANAEISAGLARLRDRSRDLIRNNPHAAKCLRVFRSHVVGVGIQPKSKNKALRALHPNLPAYRWSGGQLAPIERNQ